MLMVLYIHDSSWAPRRPRLLQSAVNTGVFAQVLVPFGAQELVAGYVVSLSDTAPRDITVKDIVEVVDTDPFFDTEYVDFLYWVADYYCASLASVIAAAIPPNFAPRLKRMVELASAEVIEPSTTTHLETREVGCRRILGVLR